MDEKLLELLPENITEYPNVILRQTGKPLEAFTVFSTMELAEKYIATDLAYPGQQVAVYDGDDKKYKYYIVQDGDNNKTLDPVADLSSLATVAKTGDYEDLINKPDIPEVYNGKLTLQGTDGLTAESKSFTANNKGNVTFTVKHAVPEGAAASEKSGSKITGITTDKFGHVTAVDTGTDENSAHKHSAGTGITLDGDGGISGTTTISHADTSTLKEGSYGPSAGGTQSAKGTLKINVPQITVDGMGHVTNVVNKEFTVTDTDTASTVKSGDVLSLSGTNELSTKYNNTAPTTVTVGGLSQGSNVDGWSLKQIVDKLLYKYTSPAISSVKYTASQANDYICGSVTFSKAVATVAANSVNPGVTSSTFTWNGQTYTGNNAGTTIGAFGTKDITFTMNYTFTGTASTTSIAAKSGTASVVLSNAGENGEAKTITKSQNSTTYYFDRSEYYWGGSASATDTSYNKDNTGNSTQRSKLGTGTGTSLSATLSNQVFTLVTPAAWGNTLKVYDGASNPVTGVFKKTGTVTITNKNNYNETYNVWKGAAATGTIKYFFQISA